MCKIGDIIVVKEYTGEDGTKLGGHSFIVIDDRPDFISGLSYDMVATVMSSFKNAEHKNKKLKYKENLLIDVSETKPRKGGQKPPSFLFPLKHHFKAPFTNIGSYWIIYSNRI